MGAIYKSRAATPRALADCATCENVRTSALWLARERASVRASACSHKSTQASSRERLALCGRLVAPAAAPTSAARARHKCGRLQKQQLRAVAARVAASAAGKRCHCCCVSATQHAGRLQLLRLAGVLPCGRGCCGALCAGRLRQLAALFDLCMAQWRLRSSAWPDPLSVASRPADSAHEAHKCEWTGKPAGIHVCEAADRSCERAGYAHRAVA